MEVFLTQKNRERIERLTSLNGDLAGYTIEQALDVLINSALDSGDYVRQWAVNEKIKLSKERLKK